MYDSIRKNDVIAAIFFDFLATLPYLIILFLFGIKFYKICKIARIKSLSDIIYDIHFESIFHIVFENKWICFQVVIASYVKDYNKKIDQ